MQDSYRIRAAIGFCRFDGCTIILDTDADRYWGASEAVGDAMRRLASGEAVAPEPLARLEALGLVEPVRGPAVIGPDPLRPALDDVIETQPDDRGFGLVAGIEVVACLAWAQLRLACFPLSAVLRQVKRQRDRAVRRVPRDDLAVLARTFRRWRALLPWTPLCLPETIALMQFAARRGHAPQFVIGVEAYPFAAHCWAQDGTHVLNDAHDHVARFRPIFVL